MKVKYLLSQGSTNSSIKHNNSTIHACTSLNRSIAISSTSRTRTTNNSLTTRRTCRRKLQKLKNVCTSNNRRPLHIHQRTLPQTTGNATPSNISHVSTHMTSHPSNVSKSPSMPCVRKSPLPKMPIKSWDPRRCWEDRICC